jgi:hypothetical protein
MHTPCLISVRIVLNTINTLGRQNNVFVVKCEYYICNVVRNVLGKVEKKSRAIDRIRIKLLC